MEAFVQFVKQDFESTLRIVQEDVNGKVEMEELIRDVNILHITFDKLESVFEDVYLSLSQDDPQIVIIDNCFTCIWELLLDTLENVKSYLDSITPNSENKHYPQTFSNSDQLTNLLHAIQFPVKLSVYDGSRPEEYYPWIYAFESSIESLCTDHQGINCKCLLQLLQYTSGAAYDSIKECALIGGKEGYNRAKHTLNSLYGDPFIVSKTISVNLRKGPSAMDTDALYKLATDVHNGLIILDKLKMIQEIISQEAILDIVLRLPLYVQEEWRKYALERKRTYKAYPNIWDLNLFIQEAASNHADPLYGQSFFDIQAYRGLISPIYGESSRDLPSNHHFRSDNYSLVNHRDETLLSLSPDSSPSELFTPLRPRRAIKSSQQCAVSHCNGAKHRLYECQYFRGMIPSDRLKFVDDNQLCRICFLNHSTSKCTSPILCKVCNGLHSSYLHV